MIVPWLLLCAALPGLIGCLMQILAVRSRTPDANPPRCASAPDALPAVSILKPLKGLDDGLFDNLESFCLLDYPSCEIIFALQHENDPAWKVVRKIMEKYPEKEIAIVVESHASGMNPKVNNLIPAYARARHELVLISDSNVRVGRDYLSAIVRHMEDPGVGLVSNVIRGVNGRSLGAVLENLHLNSFVAGSVCALDRYLGMPCVIGKSMLMRKRDLDAIGGLRGVKDFLAEDYIIGARMHGLGKKVVLSGHLISNVNEYWGLKRFLNRHTRWGKLRWQIGGPKYFSELLCNAVFMACIPLAVAPASKMSLLTAGAVSALKIAHDYYLGRRLDARMHPLLYLLSPLKDLLVGCIWFVPLFSARVAWRGNHYIIGRNSALSPVPDTRLWSLRHRVFSAIRARFA